MFRVHAASVVIVTLLAVTGFDIATGLEHWPFGSYPMYSLTYPGRHESMALYALRGAGEVSLRSDRGFAPFDDARLVSALSGMPPRDWPQALNNLVRLYNRNHPAPIRALRLYSVSWNLHTGMKGDEPPDNRILLAEVQP